MSLPRITDGLDEVMRLRPGVFHATDPRGRDYLLHRTASQQLGELTTLQRNALRELAQASRAIADLRDATDQRPDDGTEVQLDELLTCLYEGGWLLTTVIRDGREAYTVAPYRRPAAPRPTSLGVTHPVLSRFAVLRRDGDNLVIESPRSWCTIQIHDPDLVWALAALIAPGAGHQSSLPAELLPPKLTEHLLTDLAWSEMVVADSGAEDTDFALRQWKPHELWFHQRSRGDGVPEGHFGRTRWAAGEFESLPARRRASGAPVIDLARPDLGAIRASDPALTEVLEQRRSVREHDDQRPITVGQLGDLLYRATGVRATAVHDGVDHVTGPNPSGGALDPLEFWIAVRLVDGLPPGLYRYDRFDHRLESICGPTTPVRRLIDKAQLATGGLQEGVATYPPQVVVVVTARFGRVGWSYESLTYSLILKQVGVAYQTMYCVATAMGLAGCALGAGDPFAFTEATGLDPIEEAPVGEFILGSRPAAPNDATPLP